MAKHKPKPARTSGKRQRDKMAPRAKVAKSQAASKKATCLALLDRAEGATIAELQRATGWQPHSVRGFLAGTVNKMAGVILSSTKAADGLRRYQVRRAGGHAR